MESNKGTTHSLLQQWWIQDFPDGDGRGNSQTPTCYFGHFCPNIAWNWKKNRWRGVFRTPLDPFVSCFMDLLLQRERVWRRAIGGAPAWPTSSTRSSTHQPRLSPNTPCTDRPTRSTPTASNRFISRQVKEGKINQKELYICTSLFYFIHKMFPFLESYPEINFAIFYGALWTFKKVSSLKNASALWNFYCSPINVFV